jgi:Zn finger protein HypA/HybF involved in hydrogenase expression
MKSYCSKDSNYANTGYCKTNLKNDQQMSNNCKKQSNFLTNDCLDFCSNQYEKGTNSEYAGVCIDTARTYCKTHKGDSRCNCLNAVYSEDFQELEDALPESIANYMCFWKDCKNTSGWRDQFKPNSTTYQCPECAQKIEIDGSSIQSDVVNIDNSCNFNGGGDGGGDDGDGGDSGPVDVVVNIYKNNQTLSNILIGLIVLMILLVFI